VIEYGGTANLTWDVNGADIVSIDNGIGNVSSKGFRVVKPTRDIIYTLTAIKSTDEKTVTTEIMANIEPVFLDYYYDSTCGECQIKLDFVKNTYVNKTPYTDFLTFNILIINEDDTAYNEWERICIKSFNYTIYPIIVIRNDEFTSDAIDEFHMDKETIDDTIIKIQNGNYKNT